MNMKHFLKAANQLFCRKQRRHFSTVKQKNWIFCAAETIFVKLEKVNSAFLDSSALLDSPSQQWEIWRWVVR